MENAHKKREWVKTVAIIFLLILLILTFFSNTIMNMTLAEVSTVEVKDGSISAKVRATGKVAALGNNEVKAEGTRTIAAVKVKEGQEVSEGDILFVMGEAASEELESATDARDSAYFALRRQQAGYPIDNSYDSYTVAVEAVDAANRRVADAKQAYAVAAASHESELLEARQNLDMAESAYNTVLFQYNSEQSALDGRVSQAESEATVTSNEYNLAAEAYYQASESSASITINTETGEPITGTIDYNDLSSKEQRKNKAHQQMEAAQTELALAKEAAKHNPLQQALDVAYSALETAKARMSAAEAAADLSGYTASISAAENALTSAQSSATSAYSSYIASQAQYNQSVAQQNINTEEAQLHLDKQQAKVDKLSGVGEDCNVYAKVSGIVSSLSFSSGDKVTKDDVMCTIEVPDMGYKLESTVTKDQAARIKVGDLGEQTNYYWGKSITGTISSIKADPRSPQDKRIVTFDLEGDVTSGQELTLSVGSRTASYDYIVPKSAVKSDNNGNFVLKIESKNNALGNRYFAKRVTVEILAEDDSFRAVSGEIGYGDFVITNSSTKVNPGDQVRLADNNG